MMRKVILAPMLALTILLLTSPFLFTAIGDGVESVNYVVSENNYVHNPDIPGKLSIVNSAGGRAVICEFPLPSFPEDVKIDSSGNYIIDEPHVLSKITPDGVRTVIYTFSDDFLPRYIAIDSSGNYIVAGDSSIIGDDRLLKVTPASVMTVIYTFPDPDVCPTGLAIDSSGNYIVCEMVTQILSKVTPDGVRTVIYTFAAGTYPNCVTVDSSGNYIVTEYDTDILSKITPTGERTVIYTFTPRSAICQVVIDSSGNYIVCEYNNRVLSKVTPAGERTVIYTFPADTGNPNSVAISTAKAPELFCTDVTENGLTVTWAQSTDPFFAGYEIYQSSVQGELGSLIGTNTDIADTSLVVTGLSPGTTYYFTLRVLGTEELYVDSAQRSETTAKAFWQERWFPYVVVVVVMVIVVAALAIFMLRRSRKKAKVT